MKITDRNDASASPDILADAESIANCVATGKPIPLEIARRVRERADRARQEVVAAHGVQDIGVQIIREIRGELPES